MSVRFKRIFGALIAVENLLKEAAEFASTIPPERLISISHSVDGVTVWYWAND